MKRYNAEWLKAEWTLIRPILNEIGCRYEVSEIDAAWVHVEICCTPDVAEIINTAVDNL